MSLNKKGYYQGGGGVNEPTPGEKKYKSDPAIVVQPRFKEPFYRNYDLYTIPGMEDIGPGTGWHGLQNYKDVKEFLKDRRERLKPRYVADDSWIVDSGEHVKKNPDRKARMALLQKILKTAGPNTCGFCGKQKIDVTFPCEHCGKGGAMYTGDENDGPNYDLGKGLYQEMSDGKVDSVEEFREEGNHGPGALMADDNEGHMMPPGESGQSIYNWKNSPYQGTPGAKNKKKKDTNDIDFPIDDMVNRQDQMIYPIEDEYEIRRMKGDRYKFPSEGSGLDPAELSISMTSPQIAGEHSYLPEPDFEDRPDNASQLDFGRDYADEETGPARGLNVENLEDLEDKYLEPSETDLFGLPDGIDPISDLDPEETADGTEPYKGISDISEQMYEDKWNI